MSITKTARKRDQKAGAKPAASSRGPGRPRDDSKDAAIIGAAQRLFLERGFAGVSVDAIAEAAGVAKATVYARFADKEELLKASITSKCGEFLGADVLGWRPGRDFRQALIEISRRFLALVTNDDARRMHRLIALEGEKSSQLPTLFFESAIKPTVSKLAHFIETEGPGVPLLVEDAEQAAWCYLGMVKGQDHVRAELGVEPRSAADIERHIAACADIFITAHRAPKGLG